jgi:hypothetical protein
MMKIILLGDPLGENTTGRSIVVRTVFHQIPPISILSELKVCRGNDIGHTETPCGLLTYQIKVTFVSLFIEILPGCPIIWSSILPRIKWRLSKNTTKMEKTRRRINRHVKATRGFSMPNIVTPTVYKYSTKKAIQIQQTLYQ